MQPATPNPYRWTRRRWYTARRLARLAERGGLRSNVDLLDRYLRLIDSCPALDGIDPLAYPLRTRALWRDGIPF